MDFLFNYVFRRFFVHVYADRYGLHLRKGLLIRRTSFVPTDIIASVEVVRTPLLRLLHGRRIVVDTLSGRLSFYLHDNEPLQLLPIQKTLGRVRPSSGSILLGALCETKALGAAVLFATAISRIGSVFGSGYYNRMIAAITKTAEGLNELLSELRIAVPRIAATLAVFIGAAWLFSYLRNIARMCRFTAEIGEHCITVRHGLFTLYESTTVTDDRNAAIIRTSAASLLFRAAPVYYGKTMILPPMRNDRLHRSLHLLTGMDTCAVYDKAPPDNALLGHIAVPFGWGIAAAAALLLCYIIGAGPVLRTLLWASVWLCAWYSFLFAIYMRRSGAAVLCGTLMISARRGATLYTAVITGKCTAYLRTDRSVFQLKSNTCDLRVYCRGRLRLRLRSIPWDQRTFVITDTSFTL